MATNSKGIRASKCGARLRSLGFHLPGSPIPLAEVDLPDDLRRRLATTGQEFTYRADGPSTDLAVAAAREAMDRAGIYAADIGLVISAPTLLTAYGFEIPAVAIRAALGLVNADCLNISQGCVGVLAAMRFAAHFLRCEPHRGDVLVVTACCASSLLDGYTHGAFSWGDGAAAAVLTAEPGPGLNVEFYAERSATDHWGAMRIPHGDGVNYLACNPAEDLRIVIDFPDQEAQIDYIVGEKDRCSALIDALVGAAELDISDIGAVFLPSFGRKRVPLLLEGHPVLQDRVASDFRYAHMGGVDVLYFLDRYLAVAGPAVPGWYLALTPAFTAQWGGILLRFDPDGS